MTTTTATITDSTTRRIPTALAGLIAAMALVAGLVGTSSNAAAQEAGEPPEDFCTWIVTQPCSSAAESGPDTGVATDFPADLCTWLVSTHGCAGADATDDPTVTSPGVGDFPADLCSWLIGSHPCAKATPVEA